MIRKLLLALAVLFATPALAAPSFSITDTSCALGLHCVFTITRAGAYNAYSDLLVTESGASGESTSVKLRFNRADNSKSVAIKGVAAGTFMVTISRVRNATIARAMATGMVLGPVVPPAPVPPPPPPKPLPGTALLSCPAVNRPDSLVAGQLYSIVGFAHMQMPGDPPTSLSDIVILNDSTHKGDGYFALFVPVTCVQF